MGLPVGLVYDGAGHVVLDPDAGVQQALRHLFAVFARTGSARAVVAAFAAEKLPFPVRISTGPRKGELAWMPLTHWRVLRTLHNPRYAGAFVYGRRRGITSANGKNSLQPLPRDQWTALIPGAHPGYITWETYEANQQILAGNAAARGADRAAGPAREGTALLQGLAICGRCGRRMTIRYHARGGTEVPDYQCMREAIDNAGPRCQAIPGAPVDAAIGQLLLEALTPLTLEVALTVQAEIEARAAEADAMRASHVERARHRADLARRRYLAVDPGNRLVATTLEADWNAALRALQAAQDDYDNATAATAALTEDDKARIRALAADFPALWTNPATPQRERKRMARLLIDDVTITKTDRIHLDVRFRGGQTTSLDVPIPPPVLAAPPDPPRDPRRARPAPRRPHRRPGRRRAQRRRAPLRRRQALHRPHRARATPQPPPAQPRRPAPRPRPAHPRPRPPAVSACTPPPSRPGAAPGYSPPTRPTTRTSRCSTRPTPPTPGWPNARAASSPGEFTPQQHQEVQYETHFLSSADPGRPIDWRDGQPRAGGAEQPPRCTAWVQGIVATPSMEVLFVTMRERQRQVQLYRGQMPSPGRPTVAWREDRVRFWAAIRRGASSEDAGCEAGVSPAVGTRWFRQAGGVAANLPPAVSGRYLSFAEREDIAIWHAQKAGVREIARRLGRAPSTISRELRRNASTRTWRLDYRASTAQWHAERRARRPKVVEAGR